MLAEYASLQRKSLTGNGSWLNSLSVFADTDPAVPHGFFSDGRFFLQMCLYILDLTDVRSRRTLSARLGNYT